MVSEVFQKNRRVQAANAGKLSEERFTVAAFALRVAAAFRPASRRFLVSAAFWPAAFRLRVSAAFYADCLRLRVNAAFLPGDNSFAIASEYRVFDRHVANAATDRSQIQMRSPKQG
jgi:hypothetical protein